MKRVPPALLPGLLLLASAHAGGAGDVELAAGHLLEGDPLALLLIDPDGRPVHYQRFEVRAQTLRVQEWSGAYHHVGDVYLQTFANRNETYEVHDAVVTLAAPTQEGHVGIHPDPGACGVSFVPDRTGRLEPTNHTEVSAMETTGSKTRERNQPEVPYYYHTVDEPHLRLVSEGSMRYSGKGILQVYGPDLMLRSREKEARLDTGMGPASPLGAGEVKNRWVVLEAENLTVTVHADAPWTMAFAQAHTDEAILTPSGVVLRPAAPQSAPAPQATRATPLLPWVLGLAALGVVAGGAGALVHRRRRVREMVRDATECWDPEECMHRVALHVEAGRPGRALAWVERARELAPTSARACAMHALVLQRLGRLDEALAACEEACVLAPGEGEHALDAARVAARAGRPPAALETLLARALERAPHLAEEVEQDPAFLALRERPALRHALERAWAAYALELSGEEGYRA